MARPAGAEYPGGPLRVSPLPGGGASVEIAAPASPISWGPLPYEPILTLIPDPSSPGGIREELPDSGAPLLRHLRSGRVGVRDLSAAYGRAAAMIRAAAQDESNEKQKERKEP